MIIGSNAVVAVYNMINGTKTNTYPVTPDIANMEAYIESQKAELVQVLGEQSNVESFLMYCEPIDISVGDKVVDDGGREYRVVGIERHDNNQDVEDLFKIIMNSKNS